jgi:prepilin-type N-terminal cleavage/methylation domain-containing protein
MSADRGFTLTELLMTIAVLGTILVIAVPVLGDVADSQRLGQSTRELERELQTARMKAVATNRTQRVLTNCPEAGQFRMVELIGNANDARADRCSMTAFPYPAADTDPITRPNHDGPVRYLQRGVTVPTDGFEFRPDGTVRRIDTTTRTAALMGAPVNLTLTKGTTSKTISVNNMGKVRVEAQ